MRKLQNEIISVLDIYLTSNKKDRKSLSTWANKTMGKLMSTESVYDLENLVLYPFLSILSIDDPWEMCTDEQIAEIYNVLNGSKSSEYSCFIKLEKSQDIELLEKDFLEYINSGKISDEVREKFNDLKKREVNTIQDLLLIKLLSLLLTLPSEQDFEIDTSTIMVSIEEIDVSDIIEDIKKIFNYIQGNKAVHINILYNAGVSNIMIF